jgi:hypothetical protein
LLAPDRGYRRASAAHNADPTSAVAGAARADLPRPGRRGRVDPALEEARSVQRTAFLAFVAAAVAGVSGAAVLSAARGDDQSSQVLDGKLPVGYRDWKLISVAHEAGKLNDLRAVLGNDAAIKAYRDGTLPFPDGAIIGRLAWSYVPSAQNDKVFGQPQSFVAGAPTNVQFMVKDSRAYAATGGWGFAQFDAGKPTHVVVQDCFACHVPAKARDYVFTSYAP